MSTRTPPAAFVQRLKATCGADWDCRWNGEVGRWEFVSNSVAGQVVSQFLGWFVNPFTGERLEPDPTTGLLPFRDLTPDAQDEVIVNLTRSYIGNREDGAGNFKRQFEQRMTYNRDMRVERNRQHGLNYANIIKEVDLARPWVKYHQRNAKGSKIYVGA